MLDLLPMALASAIYPSLLTAVVLIVGQPNPRRLLSAYLIGALIVSIGSGLIVVFALDAGEVASGSGDRFGPGVDLAIGALALVLFWVLLTDRDRRLRERRRHRRSERHDDRDPWSRRILSRGSLRLTFLLGMALSFPGAVYLVALKDIAESEAGTATVVLWVVVYNLIMFAMAEIPLLSYTVAPDRTTETVNRGNAWLGSHGRQVAMTLCAGAGVILLVRGFVTIA